MDEVDKILKDYVSTHNKKIDIYFIYCEFKIQFVNNSTRDLKTDCVHNMKIEKISQSIEYLESKGYIFQNNNQMTKNTVSDRCNMKYEYYMHPPMFPLETKLNIIIAKNTQLLDQNIKHPLIRKNSHISFRIKKMYITNVSDYDNTTSSICTDHDNFDIIIPALLFSFPCGLSFLCLTSIMV